MGAGVCISNRIIDSFSVMPSTPVIEIKELYCSYVLDKENTVLYIRNLDIPAGEVVFLLGSSGSGKSTLLETLGLMNHTIASGSVVLNLGDSQRYEYHKLWDQNDTGQLSNLRRFFLSFIFQNTNLMENFTAYENICLSQMIKTGVPQQKAMDGAVELMEQVGLPLSAVDAEKLSVNLSGGQRQRVSFVRALNNNFKLLLCDEPTGNLDEVNATELMKIVRIQIGGDKTAIIVSHDINLALKYADRIILITKNPEKGYGEVTDDNVFLRSQWSDYTEEKLTRFRQKILELFRNGANNDAAETESATDILNHDFNTDYKRLFALKEGRVLFGKRMINLWILTSIITLTFLAVGFANGTLSYLSQKLNDPFVRFLPIGIPFSKNDATMIEKFTTLLNNEEVINYYSIDTVTAYKEFRVPLFNVENGKTEFVRSRTINPFDPLNDFIFDTKKQMTWINGDSSFKSTRDLGIVISRKTLKRLGYPDDAKVVFMNSADEIDSTNNPPSVFRSPVPIRAIVNDMPGKMGAMVTNYFYVSWLNNNDCVFDFRTHRKKIIFYVSDQEIAKSFVDDIKKMLASYSISEVVESEGNYDTLLYRADVRINNECEHLYSPGQEVWISLDTKPVKYQTTEFLYKKIIGLKSYEDNQNSIVRIFDYNNAAPVDEDLSRDYLSVIFADQRGLDSITPFSNFIFRELNASNTKDEINIIDIDAGSIQEKKNFNYISKMTFGITVLLVLFAVISISMFISNLLKTHLNKVKMNLGTYKAFGLSDSESVKIYLKIMLRFTMTGLLAAFVISLVIGNSIDYYLRNAINIADIDRYFKFFDGWSYFIIFVILLVTILTSYLNINRILSKTPGDLIYNR